MTDKVEIKGKAAEKLTQLSDKVQKTVDELVLWLLDNYTDTTTLDEQTMPEEDTTWTDEELAELLKPKKPLTGREIVEGGFVGGWEHKGIDDPVEFLERQRATRRRNKFS